MFNKTKPETESSLAVCKCESLPFQHSPAWFCPGNSDTELVLVDFVFGKQIHMSCESSNLVLRWYGWHSEGFVLMSFQSRVLFVCYWFDVYISSFKNGFKLFTFDAQKRNRTGGYCRWIFFIKCNKIPFCMARLNVEIHAILKMIWIQRRVFNFKWTELPLEHQLSQHLWDAFTQENTHLYRHVHIVAGTFHTKIII